MEKATVAIWLEILQVDRYASLLMSDLANSPVGWRWQIKRRGVTSLEPYGLGEVYPLSIFPWQTWGTGRWRHLAVTFDALGRKKTVTYLDGRRVYAVETTPDQTFICFGSAQIGNWNPNVPRDTPRESRNFYGRIDELAIFARVLTDQELAQMYEAGRSSSQ